MCDGWPSLAAFRTPLKFPMLAWRKTDCFLSVFDALSGTSAVTEHVESPKVILKEQRTSDRRRA